MLSVILALWSPDFPHAPTFAWRPRLFGLLTWAILTTFRRFVNDFLVFVRRRHYNISD